MKKVWYLCLIFALCLSLCACGTDGASEEEGVFGIPARVVREIQKAYYEDYIDQMEGMSADDVKILSFYGEYSGAYAVFLSGAPVGYPQAEFTLQVNGLPFIFASYHTMDIYCDGELYGLSEAFDGGILSEADLQALYEAYKARHADAYIEQDVRAAYYNEFVRGTDREAEVSPEALRVWIYGKYPCGIAAFVTGDEAYSPQKTKETVGCASFRYDTDQRILFFTEEGILTLPQAYEKWLVNDGDLLQIEEVHSLRFSIDAGDWIPENTERFTASWASEVQKLYYGRYSSYPQVDSPEDLTVTFYGKYSAGYAVSVALPEMNYRWEYRNEDTYFTSWNGHGIYFYRDGALTDISEVTLPDGEWNVLQSTHRTVHPEYYYAPDLCRAYYDRYIKGTPAEDTVRIDSLCVSAVYVNNGCIAGIVQDGSALPEKEWYESAGGHLFRYPTEARLVFLQQGEIYTLAEVGKNGLVFRGDLEQLHLWHKSYYPQLYGAFAEAECSDALSLQIRQDYYDRNLTEHNSYFTPDRLVLQYYGAFDGAHAVAISGLPTTDGGYVVVVEGFCFGFGRVCLYRDGVFYSLNQALREGILTREGLSALHAAYEAVHR